MPLPLVLGAPAVVNGVAILATGLVVADQVNRSLSNPSEGFSDNYAPPQLGGFEPVNVAQQSLPVPPENPVWDGRSTGTGLLENQLADSHRQSLRDSYMPLVGSPPLASPQTTQAQGKSSSVPTPRSGEILRDKLSPQLGSAADLFQKNIGTPFANSIAGAAKFNPNFQNFPFFGFPFFGNSDDQGDGVFSGFANGYSEDAGRVDSYPLPNPPPFKGGQSPAILYKVSYGYIRYDGATITSESINAYGAISYSNGIITYASVNGNTYTPNAGNFNIYSRNLKSGTQPWLISIVRLDGLTDTGGDPPPLIPNQAPSAPPIYPPANEWLYGDVNVKVGGVSDAPKIGLPDLGTVTPMAQTSPPDNQPTVENPAIAQSAGFTSVPSSPQTTSPQAISPQVTDFSKPVFLNLIPEDSRSESQKSFDAKVADFQKNYLKGAIFDPSTGQRIEGDPLANFQKNYLKGATFDPSTGQRIDNNPIFPAIAPNTSQIYQSGSQVTPTTSTNTTTTPIANTTPNTKPVSNDTQNVLLGLAGLAATVTALKIGSDLLVNASLSNTPKIDQIAANTTPVAQQTNAKQGVCDAMQPQQCGYEGVKQATTEATNPIKDQTVANAGLLGQVLAAIANLASTIATLFSNVVGKLDGIKTFLEKVASAAKLDKIYNLLTFITVVHNAQMLSTSLATTLMDTLSLGLATFGIKDENDSPIDIQQIINKSTEDTVKSIIGAENYTTLSDRWKKAVRVYQAAANITYQVRSLWDSAKSLAELTGANVGKIGNALRRDGVVSENAYGAMADNPLMVNSAMTKLQNLEEAASHLNAITSETYGITETVTQIKKDQDDFKKLAKEGTSSLNPIVNDQQKAKDDAAKIASVSPSISTTDLSKP